MPALKRGHATRRAMEGVVGAVVGSGVWVEQPDGAVGRRRDGVDLDGAEWLIVVYAFGVYHGTRQDMPALRLGIAPESLKRKEH